MKPVVSVLLLCSFTFGQSLPQCSVFNAKTGPFITSVVGTQDHIDGAHVYSNSMTGEDDYTGQGYGILCNTTCKADSGTAMSEGGLYATAGIKHVDATADSHGIATGLGQLTASATGVGEADQCPLIGGCDASVGVTPIHFSGAHVIWTETTNYTNTCPAHKLPNAPAHCLEPPAGTSCPPGQRWVPQICACNVSPLAIDTKGKASRAILRDGIFLAGVFSDPARQYVTFDMAGNGHYQKYSFPLPGSGVMWLVLDAEHNHGNDPSHEIDSGKKFFGSFSPHADWKGTGEADGWQALDWYDQPAHDTGGQGQNILDKRNPIWQHLRLWEPRHCFQDMNAPCVATSDELYRLEEKGITSISLIYTSSKEVDLVSGVQLGSYSLVNVLAGQPQASHDDRTVIDFWISKKRD